MKTFIFIFYLGIIILANKGDPVDYKGVSHQFLTINSPTNPQERLPHKNNARTFLTLFFIIYIRIIIKNINMKTFIFIFYLGIIILANKGDPVDYKGVSHQFLTINSPTKSTRTITT